MVTHGGLAREFRSALEHIVGAQSQLETIAIDRIERLPLTQPMTELLGVNLPLFRLHAFESAAASKLLIALVRAS